MLTRLRDLLVKLGGLVWKRVVPTRRLDVEVEEDCRRSRMIESYLLSGTVEEDNGVIAFCGFCFRVSKYPSRRLSFSIMSFIIEPVSVVAVEDGCRLRKLLAVLLRLLCFSD